VRFTFPIHLIVLDFIVLIIFCEEFRSWSPSLYISTYLSLLPS
jgi:hypothetical protein